MRGTTHTRTTNVHDTQAAHVVDGCVDSEGDDEIDETDRLGHPAVETKSRFFQYLG